MTDKAIEAAAKVMCRSGKFETGHGTCALMCMSQLGDPRKRGCQDALTVFGDLMRSAISAYEQAIEPTSDMLTAGARSIGNTASTANHIERAKQCWAAMQAVKLGSPLPPPPGKEG